MVGPVQTCGANDCDCIYGAGSSAATQCKNQLATSGGTPSIGVATPSWLPHIGNWQDFGIRSGLVLLGAILVIIVLAKALTKPTVQILSTAAKTGALD